jgi:predicted DNA-binding transcriptional regulator AlpA
MPRKHAPSPSVVDDIKLIRFTEVAEALGVSTWTLGRWIRRGEFPPPLYLTTASGPGVFRIKDIASFLDKRRRARRVKPRARGMMLKRGARALAKGGDHA